MSVEEVPSPRSPPPAISRSLAELPAELTSLLPWPRPHWHAGTPGADRPPATSLVITRSVSDGDGVRTQRFVPSSHLTENTLERAMGLRV